MHNCHFQGVNLFTRECDIIYIQLYIDIFVNVLTYFEKH